MQSDIPERIETTPVTPEAEAQAARRTQMMLIAGGVLLFALLITAIVLMATYTEATIVIRDIAIVFVAVETFFIGVTLILLVIQIQLLIKMLREEIQPLLHSVNETASTVRGTTEFMSENLVSPVIKVAGFSAAVRQVTSNLVGVVKGVRPRKQSVTHNNPGGHNGTEE